MRRSQPGELLLHPAILGALALLVANDHYFKAAQPGAVSGLLSDVAGLALFPVLAVSIAEIVVRAPLGSRVYFMAAGLCALVFGLVELTAVGDVLYEEALGSLQAPLRALGLVAGTDGEPVRAVSDPLDLAALPAAALGPLLALRRDLHHRQAASLEPKT